MSDFRDLAVVIEGTIRASERTSDEVLSTYDALAGDLRPILAELSERLTRSGRLADDLPNRVRGVSQILDSTRQHLCQRRELLQDFRVAMFGRTGAGKSSLIEAVTRGDA